MRGLPWDLPGESSPCAAQQPPLAKRAARAKHLAGPYFVGGRVGFGPLGANLLERRGALWVGGWVTLEQTREGGTTPVHQLVGTANAQTAPAATSTAPAHQQWGSANTETTPVGAQAAAADKTQ